MKNKRGESPTPLIENILYLILNLIFLTILITFLIQQSSGAALLEQTYAKKVALLIDQAKPGMIIKLNLEKGMKIADKDNISPPEILVIENNFVKVTLSDGGGHEYHFFNDIDVKVFPETNGNGDYSGIYVLTVNKKLGEGVGQ